jgi:hypothetical protein
LLLVWEVHTHAAPAATRDGLDVVGDQMYPRMIPARTRFSATGFTPPDCVGRGKCVVGRDAPCLSREDAICGAMAKNAPQGWSTIAANERHPRCGGLVKICEEMLQCLP